MAKNTIRLDTSSYFVRSFAYAFISLLAFACLIPFLLMIGTSFTNENVVRQYGFNLWPRKFDLLAYRLVFENPNLVIGSYAVTIIMTFFGTAIGLFLISMAGYALQRPDFDYRNTISFYIYFTTLFSGGLVPYYLLIVKVLGLKNNYLAVFLPLLMSPWLIILMKNFTKSIPFAITESAKIDGASDFLIFMKIILPMSKPALATVGLFLALSYWNEWYNSMLFLEANVKYRPLQLFLYNVVNKVEYIRNSAASSNIPPMDIPLETMKMATALVAIGPIMLVYPFIQKYFIRGITIGAVKG
ncbi:MAG TPA: carbohydrate ABC transporter permease [Clostridiales bacterium]|nr:carbohydrate ABC transporter permease [Clostridiales bacterium]